jgi:HAE1 family hydrophobic/amphiphilic exporter-1
MIRTLLVAIVLIAPSVAAAQDLPTAEAYLGKETALSVRDAVFLALQNNLDLQVARTEPAIAEQGVRQARGAFDPVLFASYRFNHDETPVASALQVGGGALVGQDEWNYTGGFGGIAPLGLNYQSTVNQRRLDSDSSIVSLDPEWRAQWKSEITLPLLKDFINNEANVTVKRSRVARNISNEDFRRRLIDLVAQVESAYWELAAARAGQRVEQKSLQTAQDLLEQTRVQYEVGVVSKVLVSQAEAGVAEREVDAIIADNRAANAQDALLNLVLAPGTADFASTALLPKDPAFIAYDVDLAEALEKAQNLRPELEQAREQVRDAEIQLAFAENQRLPRLDVTSSYQFDGLSGSGKDPTEVLGCPPACNPLPDLGGSSSTFDRFFRGDGAHSWSVGANVGANVEIPFPNTTARARVAQRRIELRRARTDLHRVEQQVILEVRDAVRLLRSTLDALDAAERRVAAQEETLRAEQEKLRLGDSTPHDVLEFEKDLVEAERQQILALQRYREAITAVERSQSTLLETRSISVAEERVR